MNIERNDLINGIQRGFERTSVHFGVPLKGQREEIESDLRRVFEAWPGEIHPRFVRLFAEMATVAVAARRRYEERALTNDDLTDFLKRSTEFFNSFTHR